MRDRDREDDVDFVSVSVAEPARLLTRLLLAALMVMTVSAEVVDCTSK
jgi:hypothetical protein